MQSVKKWEKTQQGHGCSWRGRQLQHFVSSARLSSRSSSCLESLVICYTWEASAVFLALTKQCSSHPSSQKSSSISPTLQISAHEVKFFIVITGIRKKKSDCAKQCRCEEVGPAMTWCRWTPTNTHWDISSSPPGTVQTIVNFCKAQPSTASLPPSFRLRKTHAMERAASGPAVSCGFSEWPPPRRIGLQTCETHTHFYVTGL